MVSEIYYNSSWWNIWLRVCSIYLGVTKGFNHIAYAYFRNPLMEDVL